MYFIGYLSSFIFSKDFDNFLTIYTLLFTLSVLLSIFAVKGVGVSTPENF